MTKHTVSLVHSYLQFLYVNSLKLEILDVQQI